MTGLPSDALLLIVKRDCPTCRLIEPAIHELARGPLALTVLSQDDPAFPPGLPVEDGRDLARSHRLGIEIVPTLLRLADGREAGRATGWQRAEWRGLSGLNALGEGLPEARPGCGALNVAPGMPERLRLKLGEVGIASRAIAVAEDDDEMEVAYGFGWTDGLPIVPPTDLRIVRMLAGTGRKPGEVVGLVPPNYLPCTVEKVAINAVMAGCKPEYLPVVLAVLEAALLPIFAMHGLLATMYFSGPVIIVNGPIARAIGMNSGVNALGQGNRANATIGRALQLIIRNVGGGVPGGIDRATLGNPGKYTFCFAEDESDPEWTPLSVARGIPTGRSAVTLFHGDGVTALMDQKSRTADELSRSLAMGLAGVGHPKLAEWANAILVLSPEHYAIFRKSGWRRAEIEAALRRDLMRPGASLLCGAGGVGEGIAPERAAGLVHKFHPDGLLVVRAGGRAGLMSAIIGGWSGGRLVEEVQPVSKEIEL
ncbi:MAG: thioredoxin family protein [Alphaproteobacteria bacterium]|nr:thioredoxin family protein [Alphaproteobacteria bacterium]